MREWGWLLGLFVLAIGIGGFLFKLHGASVLDALEQWRRHPRAVVAAVIEIAVLLAVAGVFTTTSGWAAVGWYVAGLAVAASLLLTTHQILRNPASEKAEPQPQPTEPLPAGKLPPVGQPFIWVRSRGQQWPLHAAPVTGGAAEPRAYCGYEYDRGELVKADIPVIWLPQHNPKYQTCEVCRTALVKAGHIRR